MIEQKAAVHSAIYLPEPFSLQAAAPKNPAKLPSRKGHIGLDDHDH
jgi:hypothetical protein